MPTLSLAARKRLHAARWLTCTRCPLCRTRKRVVLYRGTVPCDVLFVGQGPGKSEDVLGEPFVGPAGRLMDRIISRALDGQTYALDNVVGCMPVDDEGDETEPDIDEIRACAPRLMELLQLALPKLVVCVGKIAETWLDWNVYPPVITLPGWKTQPMCSIVHPSHIGKANPAARGLMVDRCVVAIRSALEELQEAKEVQDARTE